LDYFERWQAHSKRYDYKRMCRVIHPQRKIIVF
jgi:hypothetical protein